MNLNKVTLAGNLTRDPEMRFTTSNTAVANIGIAVNRKWKDNAGKVNEDVLFIDCEAWGRTAEVINEHLRKGDPIFIEGRLKLDQWEDRDGGKRSKIKVVVESFQFIGGRRDDEPRGRESTRQAMADSPQGKPVMATGPHVAVDADDIPW